MNQGTGSSDHLLGVNKKAAVGGGRENRRRPEYMPRRSWARSLGITVSVTAAKTKNETRHSSSSLTMDKWSCARVLIMLSLFLLALLIYESPDETVNNRVGFTKEQSVVLSRAKRYALEARRYIKERVKQTMTKPRHLRKLLSQLMQFHLSSSYEMMGVL